MKILLALTMAASAWANPPKPLTAPEQPEDLGPAVIDVSAYPAEHQKTYREIFLPLYASQRGGAARAVNSALIELDPQGEQALRREHPELFGDSRLAAVAPDAWRREVLRLKNRPPCCGACPVLSKADAQALWHFLAYDSLQRKTGPAAASWAEHRRRLIERFEAVSSGGSRP